MYTVKETYKMFKEEYHESISFSTFEELRPNNILLTGQTPQHVCCCITHNNFQALCNSLASTEKFAIQKYNSDWVKTFVLCDNATSQCLQITYEFWLRSAI